MTFWVAVAVDNSVQEERHTVADCRVVVCRVAGRTEMVVAVAAVVHRAADHRVVAPMGPVVRKLVDLDRSSQIIPL